MSLVALSGFVVINYPRHARNAIVMCKHTFVRSTPTCEQWLPLYQLNVLSTSMCDVDPATPGIESMPPPASSARVTQVIIVLLSLTSAYGGASNSEERVPTSSPAIQEHVTPQPLALMGRPFDEEAPSSREGSAERRRREKYQWYDGILIPDWRCGQEIC